MCRLTMSLSLVWSMRLIDFEVSAAAHWILPTTDRPAMPDLQYSATHNDAMNNLKDHVLPMRCMYSNS
jgi:hypothetical protein